MVFVGTYLPSVQSVEDVMRRFTAPVLASRQGSANTPAPVPAEEVRPELPTLSGDDDDVLTKRVYCNAAACQRVSPSSPTELCTPLLTVLSDPSQSYFFCMNEVTSLPLLEHDGGRRFVGTAGVNTCI